MKSVRVYKYGIHLGEEKIVHGNDNSGMVYFSGCHLSCNFCYTPEISFQMKGNDFDPAAFEKLLDELVKRGARNINFVSPTHVWELIHEPMLSFKRKYGDLLPVVLKVSGFERLQPIEKMLQVGDVFIPDFKVWAPEIARQVNLPASYGEVALRSIERAYKARPDRISANGKLVRGVLVRHLMMPDCLEDSLAVVEKLASVGFVGHLNFMTYFIKERSVCRANPKDVAVLVTESLANGMTPMVNGRLTQSLQEASNA